MTKQLVSLEEFQAMSPRQQGYVSYMEAEWPGSPLKKHQANPYPLGSAEHLEFVAGQNVAVLQAQDSDG